MTGAADRFDADFEGVAKLTLGCLMGVVWLGTGFVLLGSTAPGPLLARSGSSSSSSGSILFMSSLNCEKMGLIELETLI